MSHILLISNTLQEISQPHLYLGLLIINNEAIIIPGQLY